MSASDRCERCGWSVLTCEEDGCLPLRLVATPPVDTTAEDLARAVEGTNAFHGDYVAVAELRAYRARYPRTT